MVNAKQRTRGPAKPAQMSLAEVRTMIESHATVPVWPHAGQALGLSKDKSYAAAKSGDLPGVIDIGFKKVMPTAVLARLLGIEPNHAPRIAPSEEAATPIEVGRATARSFK